MNLTRKHAYLPRTSSVLIVMSKSPEAKKVAIDVEASGNSANVSTIFTLPVAILNGHVQSIPNWASSGGQLVGLKLSGTN